MIKHSQMKPEMVDLPDDEFVTIQCEKVDSKYLERYKINKLSQIKDLKTGKILKVTPREGGKEYPVVTLRTDSSNTIYRIHFLVAYTFLNKPQEDWEVDHIDRDKNNYSLENLRFVSRSENKKNRCFSETSYKKFKVWVGYSDNQYKTPDLSSVVYEKNLSEEAIKDYTKAWTKRKAGEGGLFWRSYFTNEDDLFERFEFPTDWKPIPETNAYCSSSGLILYAKAGSSELNVITTGHTNDTGYKVINLNKTLRRIHRIVYSLFGNDPNFTEDMMIDHIDTNRCNNRIENLRSVKGMKENLANETTRKILERK